MSKISNCIRMAMILRNKGTMKIKELAERLEVRERTIRDYRDELEKAGIYIESTTGKDGGYRLLPGCLMPIINLDEVETTALLRGSEFLRKEAAFLYRDEVGMAIEKIISCSSQTIDQEKNHYIKYSIPNIDTDEMSRLYTDISDAIKGRNKVAISYFSLQNGLSDRIIYPYELILYQGFWYIIGYCEKRQEIRDFKLTRIKQYECMRESFVVHKDFHIENYVGKNSIYKTKLIKVRLKIQYPMSIIVNENIWGDEQRIMFQGDNSILFEAKLSDSPETITWLLSMGSQVEIMEPEYLRDKIVDEIKKMNKMYSF